jgi:hypothetical protein
MIAAIPATAFVAVNQTIALFWKGITKRRENYPAESAPAVCALARDSTSSPRQLCTFSIRAAVSASTNSCFVSRCHPIRSRASVSRPGLLGASSGMRRPPLSQRCLATVVCHAVTLVNAAVSSCQQSLTIWFYNLLAIHTSRRSLRAKRVSSRRGISLRLCFRATTRQRRAL